VSESRDEDLARRVLGALSDGDTKRFGQLVGDEIEIHTARGTRSGHAEAVAWAANKYDHLQRRYAIGELRRIGPGRLLMTGATEYVWKDGGGLADSSPVAIELGFEDDKLTLWRFREDAS
jgi:hypothetical protein